MDTIHRVVTGGGGGGPGTQVGSGTRVFPPRRGNPRKIQGEVLYTNTDPVYTAAFPRPGTKAVFTVNVTQKGGTSPSLVVTIQHKNRDEASWGDAASFSAITDVGAYSKEATLKETVRLKFVMSGTDAWVRCQTS